jgi:hypothetical protein
MERIESTNKPSTVGVTSPTGQPQQKTKYMTPGLITAGALGGTAAAIAAGVEFGRHSKARLASPSA